MRVAKPEGLGVKSIGFCDTNFLELKTGKIARQADGAVMVRMGDSVVLCTAVSAKEKKRRYTIAFYLTDWI